MKFLIQRIKDVNVFLEEKKIESLDNGFLVFVGIENEDINQDLQIIKEKFLKLQVAEKDEKFSVSLKEANLPILFVSQITLTANFENGRINFNDSPKFEIAKEIFENFVEEIKNEGLKVKNTPFGSYLLIESTNIGPVNFIFEI
jgi:D-tyrosyl-tRNA(Tyr) deacylase